MAKISNKALNAGKYQLIETDPEMKLAHKHVETTNYFYMRIYLKSKKNFQRWKL